MPAFCQIIVILNIIDTRIHTAVTHDFCSLARATIATCSRWVHHIGIFCFGYGQFQHIGCWISALLTPTSTPKIKEFANLILPGIPSLRASSTAVMVSPGGCPGVKPETHFFQRIVLQITHQRIKLGHTVGIAYPLQSYATAR